MPRNPPRRRATWPLLLGGVLLAGGTFAVYRRTFSVPLLYDDAFWITDNPAIRHLWPILRAGPGATFTAVDGRPLLNFSFALNHAFGGLALAGYHWVNLGIHVLAGWTLFALVRRTLRSAALAPRFGPAADLLALAVSAIWLWHPVQTQSVTYLSQRAESLLGLFYLLTLYCFLRGGQTAGRGRRAPWHSLSVLACLAGVGTKEVIATAPLAVFLYDRTFISGGFAGAWRRHWPAHLALAATWLPLGYLMKSLPSQGVGFGADTAMWAYGLAECRVIVRYLGLLVWPHPLVFDYGEYEAVPLAVVWPYAVALVLLLTATIIALWRAPAAAFAACWFLLILAPTSSIIPILPQPMAENRLYLPLAGVVVLGALGAFAWAGRRVLPLLAFAAVGLGLTSFQRNRDYRSELSIWSDTVAKEPNSARAHNNLGLAWSRVPGRLNDAVTQFQEALRLQPNLAEAHNNLGNAWSKLPGRLNDAVAEYQAAVRLQPGYAKAHNNLGNAWSQSPGRMNDAVAEYQTAVRLQPDYAEARNGLGAALAASPGRLEDAVSQYQEALRLQPDYAEAHNNLGVAWSQLPGRLGDAITHFQAAVRLQPDFAEAHNNLGNAWSQLPGRLNNAIAQYREALRADPGFVEAHFNLGVAWSQTPGRLNDAIAEYRTALRLDPGYAPAWHNLGTSLVESGDLPAAAAAFREELRLLPDDPVARQALSAVLRQIEDRSQAHAGRGNG